MHMIYTKCPPTYSNFPHLLIMKGLGGKGARVLWPREILWIFNVTISGDSLLCILNWFIGVSGFLASCRRNLFLELVTEPENTAKLSHFVNNVADLDTVCHTVRHD